MVFPLECRGLGMRIHWVAFSNDRNLGGKGYCRRNKYGVHRIPRCLYCAPILSFLFESLVSATIRTLNPLSDSGFDNFDLRDINHRASSFFEETLSDLNFKEPVVPLLPVIRESVKTIKFANGFLHKVASKSGKTRKYLLTKRGWQPNLIYGQERPSYFNERKRKEGTTSVFL